MGRSEKSEMRPMLSLLKGGSAPAPVAPVAPDESEAALVADVLGGSEAAVRRFVKRYSPVLLSVIERVLSRAGRAGRGEDKDVLQQVFLEVFRDDMRYLRGWDPSRGKTLRGFLCVLADHRAHDALRKKGAKLALFEPETPDREQPSNATPEEEHRLRQVLAAFEATCTDDERRLFYWSFIENRETKAIAADLGISTQATHQRCHRLRTRLLELLAETDDPSPRPRRAALELVEGRSQG